MRVHLTLETPLRPTIATLTKPLMKPSNLQALQHLLKKSVNQIALSSISINSSIK